MFYKILITFSLFFYYINNTNACLLIDCTINKNTWYINSIFIILNIILIYFSIKKYKKNNLSSSSNSSK